MDPFVANIDDEDVGHVESPLRQEQRASSSLQDQGRVDARPAQATSPALAAQPTAVQDQDAPPHELSGEPSQSILSTAEAKPPPDAARAGSSRAATPSQAVRMTDLSSSSASQMQALPSRHTAGSSRDRDTGIVGRHQESRGFGDDGDEGREERGSMVGDAEDEALPSDEEVALMSRSRRAAGGSTNLGASFRSGHVLHRIRRRAERILARERGHGGGAAGALRGLSRRERAMWQWANVDNLDEFLLEMYAYYTGQGVWCIALSRALNLVTIAFVFGFSFFLAGCIDYSAIRHDGTLSEVIVPRCASRSSNLSLLAFVVLGLFYAWQVLRFGAGLGKLWSMKAFYEELLGIPDADVQAIPWSEVVHRLSTFRASNPITSLSSGANTPGGAEKLDAHDVANRIMRKSNYLIALFNKDVLDLTIPLPLLHRRTPTLTRTLEWNLSFCLLGFVFDEQGRVRQQFTTDRHRTELIDGLKRRFIFMAILNAIFAPFIVIYLLVFSFFRYFEEYHRNPSSLGSRQYTPFARWKFREFNELPHLFRRRCHASYPHAQQYVDQFPKERTAIVARFVAFIAGSFTAVLLLASIVDPDLFLHFEITPQRNTLFYITVFGAILAVSRGMIPEERHVFEPEALMRKVVEHTHYCPQHWKGRFHSTEVLRQFSTLYTLKISIFAMELLSVIVTPFLLWLSLPKSAPAIIDFFREFTVHVDGLGYVCSFAVFNFARNGNVRFGAPTDSRNTRLASKEGKMEQSLLGFCAANPDWQPSDPSASLFLSRMAETSGGFGQSGGAHSFAHAGGTGVSALRNGGRGVGRHGPSHHHAHFGPSAGSGGQELAFTPANSTLAARSQLYDDAFQRSISLASRPANAAALQASALKTGPRSTASVAAAGDAVGGSSATSHARRGAAAVTLGPLDEADDVDASASSASEGRERDGSDEARAADLDGSSFADERGGGGLEEGVERSSHARLGGATGGVVAPAGVQGLLQHVYGLGGASSRW